MWRRALLAAVVLTTGIAGLGATPAAAADPPPGTVVPVRITGDPAKRFNIVVVGDGYTAADLPRFREHVDRHVNVLMTIEPFKSYRSYLNVHAVEIPSAESGVSCDPDLTSARRDTPLRMGFWGGCNASSVQRLLTVDSAAATRYADLVPGTTAANRQILAIANSDTYGGAGGTYATASGGNALSALITPHELGHSLGGLDDEYDYYARGVRGDTYTGGEPTSIHHTLLTEQQMREQRQKWWRWLGEPSESGGVIGRHEGGLYSGDGVWRPSAHSMMKSLGYYFDQVSRERMTQRIAGKTSILQDATPADRPVGADRVLWVETLHPVSHRLDVTWTVDGEAVPGGSRNLDLAALRLEPGRHTVTATVTDPTPFVRDPAVRGSSALTRSRTWTVNTAITTPRVPVEPGFTSWTPTDRPIGSSDVVHAEVTHPVDRVHTVSWALDGKPVGGTDTGIDLGRLRLKPGTHTLTATAGPETLTWKVDATAPATSHELSEPLLTIDIPGRPTEYVFNGPFTMRLTGADDSTGYAVSEFRVDGDGWYNYFGWPTDPRAPFLFTAGGTTIDNLVYGKLGKPRLSPWDKVPPGYGRHVVEYRTIDPAGNVGPVKSFAVTLLPSW